MCGIVGAFSFKNGPLDITEPYIAVMRDTMAHRGPDGAGAWISKDRRVGLGHRRLSIIDLSHAADQPMCNEDGTLWIVFNGEIYNHAEIRKELEALGGHRWKTDHSDTEVVLHAFEQWGVECVHKFRGMFAIGLWDAKKRELWLIRDRIGIKPLYYSVHHGRVTFASEIKALLKDPDQKRAVHEEALFHYLSFLTTPAPQTLFDGIRKLAGGTWIRFSEDGGSREERYWDPWDHVKPLTGVPEEEILGMLMAELRTAVRLRKVSDVPVGVFLSGGIDSSTNAALFSEGENHGAGARVKTFSMGYQGEYQSYKNELGFARMMADRVGAEYHEKLLTLDDLMDFLPQMVRLQDEPIADPVCVPLYYVSKLARDNGTIVCQLGEGADELFVGYPWWLRYLHLQRRDRWPIPRWAKKCGVAALGALGRGDEFYTEWLRRGAEGVPIFWGGAESFTDSQKKKFLSPRLREKFKGRTSWEALRPIRERFEAKAWEKSDVNWMTTIDLNLRLPELLLMRVDKISMGVSLEGRVPFLDHKFVELALGIPTALKLPGDDPKVLLKKAVRGLIPDEIIDRPKQGFGVPVYEWFFDRLGDRARAEIDDFCNQSDLMDRAEVKRFAEKGPGYQVWFLLNLALWWKEYIR